MSTYRTPPPFTCPQCGAQHNRGWVDGVETFRCLRCGYVGKENASQPLTTPPRPTRYDRLKADEPCPPTSSQDTST